MTLHTKQLLESSRNLIFEEEEQLRYPELVLASNSPSNQSLSIPNSIPHARAKKMSFSLGGESVSLKDPQFKAVN